jgi:hypothetical protein
MQHKQASELNYVHLIYTVILRTFASGVFIMSLGMPGQRPRLPGREVGEWGSREMFSTPRISYYGKMSPVDSHATILTIIRKKSPRMKIHGRGSALQRWLLVNIGYLGHPNRLDIKPLWSSQRTFTQNDYPTFRLSNSYFAIL